MTTDSFLVDKPESIGYWLDDNGLLLNGAVIGNGWKLPDIIRRTWQGDMMYIMGNFNDDTYREFIIRKFGRNDKITLVNGCNPADYPDDYFDWVMFDDENIAIDSWFKKVRIAGVIAGISVYPNEKTIADKGLVMISRVKWPLKPFWIVQRRGIVNEANEQ